MISLYHLDRDKLTRTIMDGALDGLPLDTIWIDLFQPTHDEETAIERLLGISVPTHDEMQEIETSSRLYIEEGAIVMTLSVLYKPHTSGFSTAAVTFIISGNRLLTVRYADPLSFGQFTQKAFKHPALVSSGNQAFVGILEQISDNLADVLEGATADLEALSQTIFTTDTDRKAAMPSYRDAIYRIGHVGDLSTKAKGCLLNLTRLLLFFAGQSDVHREVKERMKILMQDASSIDEHARFLSAKVGFLMDATMGLINLEQNNIIKMFSVAAVIFLPPTLIASIYGMNFKVMPELSWGHGYFFALILMVLSTAIPLWLFWRKKWL
ncbi:MAG: magnesium transporter CorA family protein [Alphaproteobacteria bacterium]|nr:magnesium transporter CorA family protein [Alphaproteobacteria bacterium]